jgi:hypothetical protein
MCEVLNNANPPKNSARIMCFRNWRAKNVYPFTTWRRKFRWQTEIPTIHYQYRVNHAVVLNYARSSGRRLGIKCDRTVYSPQIQSNLFPLNWDNKAHKSNRQHYSLQDEVLTVVVMNGGRSTKKEINVEQVVKLVCCLDYFSALKMEATRSSEKSFDFQHTIRRYTSEDRTIQHYSSVNFKPRF